MADESALRLGPGDLVGLHPQRPLSRIVDEKSGGVVVVKELVQTIQDLIGEVPGRSSETTFSLMLSRTRVSRSSSRRVRSRARIEARRLRDQP